MRGDFGLETLIIKYTLGSAFLIVTLVFVGKVITLLGVVAAAKMAALKASILSGDIANSVLGLLKDAIFGGGGK